jgi:hypothetical protein
MPQAVAGIALSYRSPARSPRPPPCLELPMRSPRPPRLCSPASNRGRARQGGSRQELEVLLLPSSTSGRGTFVAAAGRRGVIPIELLGGRGTAAAAGRHEDGSRRVGNCRQATVAVHVRSGPHASDTLQTYL